MWIEERGQSAWVQEAVVGQLTPAVSLERVGDLPTALRKLSTRAYDLVLTGYDLEGGTGLDLLQSVRRHPAWIPTLVLTQRGNETVASHVMEAGGAGYLGCESLREDGRIIRAARRVLGEAALMRNWEGMLQQMHTLAISDSLTATYNRHFIGQLLEMELRRSQRYGHPFCVALIDVDGFKEINDRFGHGYGDGVLRELARLLKDQLRATDHLGRFGGDEMLVILPQTTLANARHLCRRMSQRVARHAFGTASGEALRITLSIGVSDWGGGPGVSTAQLLEDADRALYRAKLEGRNRVCHCGPGDGAPVAPTAIPRRTFPCAAGASCPLQAGRR
jgi:diguanylate cyclase (GGDEF)-like protein